MKCVSKRRGEATKLMTSLCAHSPYLVQQQHTTIVLYVHYFKNENICNAVSYWNNTFPNLIWKRYGPFLKNISSQTRSKKCPSNSLTEFLPPMYSCKGLRRTLSDAAHSVNRLQRISTTSSAHALICIITWLSKCIVWFVFYPPPPQLNQHCILEPV